MRECRQTFIPELTVWFWNLFFVLTVEAITWSSTVALRRASKAAGLTLDLLPKVLEATLAIQDNDSRGKILAAVALHLANHSDRFNLWKNLLHLLSHRNRPSLLSDIATLTSVLVVLGSEVAPAETAQAIQDVSRWWP